MGAIVSRAHQEKILRYIETANAEGAKLVYDGKLPADSALQGGCYVYPTVFTEVSQDMIIANEKVFGPVLSVIKHPHEKVLLEQVNRVEYGLTAAVFTRDFACAHHAAGRVQSGVIWVNNAGPHYLGAGYGGYKQSRIVREELIEELLSFTQSKNINISVECILILQI